MRTWVGAVAVPVIVIILGACSPGGKPAVFDGLYLEYAVGDTETCRVSFSETGKNRFSVRFEGAGCTLRPEGVSAGGTVVVDQFLRRDKSPVIWGEATNLWLPEGKRKPGTGPDDVQELLRWRDWDAAVIRAGVGILQGAWYYDTKTGFFVGMERSFGGPPNLVYVLRDTNAR